MERLFFLEQSLFLVTFFQISCFFRTKPPASSCFLRINSSLGQLLFQNSHFFWMTTYFFVAGTYTQHQIIQNSYVFNKDTSTIELLFSAVNFSEKLLFGSTYLFKKSIFCSNGFSGELLYQSDYLKELLFCDMLFSEVLICCYTSFPQAFFLFTTE